MKTEKIIYTVLVIFLLLPIFSFAQTNTRSIKEKVPSILERWWNTVKTYFGKFGGALINALKKAWQAAVALWQKMWLWIKNAWFSYLSLKIDWVVEKIKLRFR